MIHQNVELPSGWREVSLRDAVVPRREKVQPQDHLNLPYLGMDNVAGGTGRVIETRRSGDMRSAAVRFYEQDVLYGRLRPYLNKVVCANFDGLASAEFIVLPGNSAVDARFLSQRLRASDFVSFASHLNEGDRPRVNFNQIGEFELCLPPLREQRRIVAKIEELFSELDKGVESLKTARAQLKTYRQSLLEAALKDNTGSGAREVPLGDLIGQISQGWSPKCELNRSPLPQEWAVIKTTAVQPMRYESEEAKPLPSDLEPRPTIAVKAGDFLMTRKGPRSRTGVACLVKSTRENSMLCDTVYRFRCNEEEVYPEYLELVLNAPSTIEFIDSQKSGISDSGISLNQRKVKTIPVVLPGRLDVQKKIVEGVQAKLSEMRHLEAELETSIMRVDNLRQSILKRAFEGKLVSQDPDDEPASALLERIRQEQVEQPAPLRHRRETRMSA